MGWFGFGGTKATPDAASRTDRQQCWDSRDSYYTCLDSAKVLTPGQEVEGVCASEKRAYEQNCAKSWIDYFNKRRVLAEQQKDVLAQVEAQAAEARRK